MPEEKPHNMNIIFDPISKSALIHLGDRVIRLTGPFANYQEAVSAARRSVSSRTN